MCGQTTSSDQPCWGNIHGCNYSTAVPMVYMTCRSSNLCKPGQGCRHVSDCFAAYHKCLETAGAVCAYYRRGVNLLCSGNPEAFHVYTLRLAIPNGTTFEWAECDYPYPEAGPWYVAFTVGIPLPPRLYAGGNLRATLLEITPKPSPAPAPPKTYGQAAAVKSSPRPGPTQPRFTPSPVAGSRNLSSGAAEVKTRGLLMVASLYVVYSIVGCAERLLSPHW